MISTYVDTIRRHCGPLAPLATAATPQLSRLPGLRAVFFDIYGTLFISASGDVGTSSDEARQDAFTEALAAVGIELARPAAGPGRDGHDVAGDYLVESIRRSHRQSASEGIDYPEVDIVDVWRQTLERLTAHGWLPPTAQQVDLRQLAVEYEVRTNPTWPMPGADACLADLARRRLGLGLISNAQFFTPQLFTAFYGKTAEQLGFEPNWQFLSYQTGHAKPGLRLYELAADAVSERGLRPRDVLYIGNDLLNDVAAAGKLGFRTALFAGDARSLRTREGDPRVAGTTPDVVFTELSQIAACVANAVQLEEG